jgi:hypothetical protein
MKPSFIARSIILFLLFPLLLVNSVLYVSGEKDAIRETTRPFEFDYVTWTLNAFGLKAGQLSSNVSQYLNPIQQRKVVYDYLDLVGKLNTVADKITKIYSDPAIKDPLQTATRDLAEQKSFEAQMSRLEPLAESVLQLQISYVVNRMGLATAGQPLPPLLYHVTPLPLALILSPRNVIEEKYDISLLPDVPLDQEVKIENSVQTNLGLSALVVQVGGIGTYPTMVASTTDLSWLLEVICHEWTHNYLTVRPLGLNYETNSALRTMNETTADISGKEISAAVIRMFYPSLVPPPPSPLKNNPSQGSSSPSSGFDFNAEMHITRVTVDQMLAAGQIEQAEAYMETRREFFWNNGYQIRKLNQAYFAFYGAYADVPGGEQGLDPVGPAVTTLRSESPSLRVFLTRISKMTDFTQLEQAVRQYR